MGKASAAESQSKPTLDARCCSLRAYSRAGNEAGTSWKMPSRPSCSTLMRSQRLLTSAGVLGDGVGEDVGVAADELDLDVGGDAGEVAGAPLAEHEGEQHDLQQQVAELAVLRREVVVGDGVGQLVHLFDGVADDVARRLLAVPGALHAQHVDDALERHQLLAEQSVVEGGARGTVTTPGRRRRARSRRPRAGAGARAPQLARQARPVRPGERDDDLAGRGAAGEVVEALAVGRVDLEEPAAAGVGALRDEVAELAVQAGGHEDGAAAGERPQRSCGRQTGGGADVHERQAHGAAA